MFKFSYICVLSYRWQAGCNPKIGSGDHVSCFDILSSDRRGLECKKKQRQWRTQKQTQLQEYIYKLLFGSILYVNLQAATIYTTSRRWPILGSESALWRVPIGTHTPKDLFSTISVDIDYHFYSLYHSHDFLAVSPTCSASSLTTASYPCGCARATWIPHWPFDLKGNRPVHNFRFQLNFLGFWILRVVRLLDGLTSLIQVCKRPRLYF